MFNAIRVMLLLCFCGALWAVAHYEFGFYFDRAHSRGSRIYKINSYEQFIQRKTGEWPVASEA